MLIFYIHIEGIHSCVPKKDIFLWAKNSNSSFRKYHEYHYHLKKDIKKRSIFICKREDFLQDNKFNESKIEEIFKEQISNVDNIGIGFDIRILWWDTIIDDDIDIPGNFSIFDRNEVFIVQGSETIPYLKGEAIVNPSTVKYYNTIFKKLWRKSDPIDRFLSN